MPTRTLTRTAVLAAAPVLVATMSAAPVLAADGEVIRSVRCAGGVLKLKVHPEDGGRLSVEGELDTNRAGQRWGWTLTDNGRAVGSGSAVTNRISGSFTVDRTIRNLPRVKDSIRFVVKRGGVTCGVTVVR